MDFPRLYPPRLFSDENFGMCLIPQDYFHPFHDMTAKYYCPWKWFKQTRGFGSTVENDKGNYKITVDVQHYRPNEVSVKVTDNEIIVEAKHEERADAHGFVMRHFKRRYALPNHYPAENVTSALSADGVLTIIAEKNSCKDNEKIVPIKICGVCPKNQLNKDITETSRKEVINDANDTIKKLNETILQEEHSRLLKPELLKEAITEKDKETTESKTVNESLKTSFKNSEAQGANSTILEESLRKSNVGISEFAGNEKYTNLASSSGKREYKDLASSSGKREYKDLTSSSEMSGLKHLSKTVTEESSSSYKSSMLMSTNKQLTGKASEYMNKIVSAELREAADKV